MKKLTQRQVNSKYKNRYVDFIRTYCYDTKQNLYEIVRTYKDIHENTTLGQDVGTQLEFCR